MDTATKAKYKNVSSEQLEDKDVTVLSLLHVDLHKEIVDLCKQVLEKAQRVFVIAQEMPNNEGKINLQQAASMANLMQPFIHVSRVVVDSHMEEMYKQLEETLISQGAEKQDVN